MILSDGIVVGRTIPTGVTLAFDKRYVDELTIEGVVRLRLTDQQAFGLAHALAELTHNQEVQHGR